jgi:aminopeptidase N
MRSLYLTLVIFFFAACASMAQTPHVCTEHDHIVEMEAHRHHALANFSANALTSDYDIKYHRLEWTVNPDTQYIEGRITSIFTPLEDGFEAIHFDLKDNMTVNSCVFEGRLMNFDLLPNHTLAITLDRPLEAGDLATIQVNYEGIPTSTGFSSFNADEHNGVPIIWTLSQPYGARDWWPCKQSLNDKIDSIDVYVNIPVEYKAASNGVLTDIVDNGDRHTYVWKHRHPIPTYLIAIGVTNYEVYSDYADMPGGDSVEILNYIYPESINQAQADLFWTIEMMELFNDLFGPYPFADEKYGHAQFEFGGGMEHQTMSFMGGFSFELQAHELAHQWFGNTVTCGSWQDIWLNEGYATYLTGLATEYLSTPEFWFGWKRSNINRVTRAPDGSVYVRDTSGIGTIFNGRLSYSKGGLVLHMLRWVVGDDIFFQACRNFLNDPELNFGYAKTPDLIRVFEETSGMELDEFFDDWIYNEGHPSYTVLWESKDDRLYLRLDQTTSHPSVDFFEMPVPIRVFGGGGDTLIRLDHTENMQNYTVDLGYSVDSIQFDPDLWLISAENEVREAIISSSVNWALEIGRLFPNPATTYCTIEVEDDFVGADLVVRDVTGKTILRDRLDKTHRIDLSGWSTGTYFLEVQQDGERGMTKLVKQ